MSKIFSSSSTVIHNIGCLRQIFDRRAYGFDAAAFLFREVSRRMNERLDHIKASPLRALDAGCGIGDDLRTLNFRFPNTKVFGIDLSSKMLELAGNQNVVQANFSLLPFATYTFDLIWSNLALHWHAYPNSVLPEWQRVLRMNGFLMFSTFGPDTMRELRNACLDADEALGLKLPPMARMIDFIDMHNLGDILVRSGFDISVTDRELLTVIYTSPNSLLDDVRRWGTYPFCQESLQRKTNRRFKLALEAALDARRRDDGAIPLTFEVIYGYGWKGFPHEISERDKIMYIKDISKVS